MIKRVIFDIDNTLIPWKSEYLNEIDAELMELGINSSEEDIKQIKIALRKYEDEYYTFNRELMIRYLNEYTKKEYPIEFLNNVLIRFGGCVHENIEQSLIETLEYLNAKYELVVLTDWFAEGQIMRLEKIGIRKYFSDVYCAENTKRKPFKEAFLKAIGDNKVEECVMIGDNLERDIKGALNAGLKAIHYTSIKDETEDYITITKLDELMNIL